MSKFFYEKSCPAAEGPYTVYISFTYYFCTNYDKKTPDGTLTVMNSSEVG